MTNTFIVLAGVLVLVTVSGLPQGGRDQDGRPYTGLPLYRAPLGATSRPMSQKSDLRIDHRNKGSMADEPTKQEESISKGHVTNKGHVTDHVSKPRDYDDDLFIDEDPADYHHVEGMVADEGPPPELGSGQKPSSVSTPSPSALTFLDSEPQPESQSYRDDQGDIGSGMPDTNKLSSGGTKCQLLRNRALAGIQVFYTPECDRDGNYKPLQCTDDQCWCADPDGKVIPYTRQRVTDKPPDCVGQDGRKEYRVDNDKNPKNPTERVRLSLTTVVPSTPVPTLGKSQQAAASSWLVMRTDILAGIFVGTGVGLICAVILVICIVHRMKKKDEGSYVLDEPQRPPPIQSYQRAPTKEVYA